MNVNEQRTATAPAAIPVPDAATAPASNPTPTPAPVADAAPIPATPPAAVTAPVANAPAVEPDYRAMYENLRRENEILRHNAEIAQSAPVQGVSGGGAVSEPVDDFIRGFDSDTW